MVQILSQVLFTIAIGLSGFAGLYVCLASFGIFRFRRRQKAAIAPPSGKDGAGDARPITILKPVCGVDFELYQNLLSFCEQDYPTFQVLFAVRSASDPAIPVVEELIASLPGRDLSLVVNSAVHGANLKVSNLINAFPAAKHDLLVVADSDMRVGRDYLAAINRGFDDPTVGVVTCLYRGICDGSAISNLACLHINEWFLPSVLVSGLVQGDRHCFGSTMAIRREILEQAGGFDALADVLADDNMIGRFALEQGYRIELSPYVVDNFVEEKSLRGLFAHELRWARTISQLNPGGHLFSFLTYTISLAVVCGAIIYLTADDVAIAVATLAAAVGLRSVLHRVVSASLGIPSPASYWMVPIRDIMSFAIWATSFLGREVSWRGSRFNARPDGGMVKVETLEST